VTERAAQRRPVLGICGGYQMLAGTIDDFAAVESPVPASARGLGLLPTNVRFAPEKQLGTPAGAWRGL
jgi:adenosylcobyric acid synthase